MKRSEAAALQLTRYNTGKKCKNGHESDRYTTSGHCCECLSEWKSSNKSKVLSYEKSYKKTDAAKESARSRSKKYYHKNRDAILENNKSDSVRASKAKYKSNNPHMGAMLQAKRRAMKLMATPSWANRKKMLEIYKEASSRGLTVDHMVPIISDYVCGLHCEDNMQLLSLSDNASKSNKSWPDK